MAHDTEPHPFNEQAALEELERLAAKIQVSRRKREKAVEDFDTFVQTFRIENLERSTAAHAAEIARSAPAAQIRTAPPISSRPLASSPLAASSVKGPAPPALTSDVYHRRSGSSPQVALIVGSLAVAVLAIALLMWRPWQRTGSAPESAASQSAQAPTQPSAAAPPAQAPGPAAPPASPAPAPALNVELTTVRPVWTRVIVDDQKVIERLLPEGQRITLGADRTIAIRAGDAGAIQLKLDGKDLGVLGRDGQIGRRTFTAPPARTP